MPFSKKRFVAAFVAISLTAGLCSALSSCKKQPSAIVDDCLIEVEYADGKIFGKSTYTLTNRGDNPFDDVRFNLYANAYRKGAKYSPVEEKKKADVFKGGYGGITVEYARADGNNRRGRLYHRSSVCEFTARQNLVDDKPCRLLSRSV